MGALLEYELDRKKRFYERRQRAADARADLEEKGLHPDEAQKAVDAWVKTGQWNIPTSRPTGRLQQLAPDAQGNLAYGPGAPETTPVSFRKRDNVKVPYNIENGKIVKPEMGKDFLSELDSSGFRAEPSFRDEYRGGQDIYVRADTGEEVRREPNNGKTNRIIKYGSVGDGTPGRKKERSVEDVVSALKNGFYDQGGMIQDITNKKEAIAVAVRAGLDPDKHPEIKALLDNYQEEEKPVEKPGFISRVRSAFSKSKDEPGHLSADEARSILKEVGGDKEKARALAKKMGFKF
jgi:hypothetical protein